MLMPLPVDMNVPPERRLSAVEEQRRENKAAWGPIDGLEPARTPGEDAEWDRVRVEEDPELWDLEKSPPLDVLERKIAAACEEQGLPMVGSDLPEEVEPCQERLAYPDGNKGGSACDPRWGRANGWYCGNCKAAVLIMRAVDDGVPVVWQPGDPPGGVAEIEARFAEEILAGNIVGPAQAFAELRAEYEDRLAAKRAAEERNE